MLVVITGLSGAGKSTSLRILEDLGYYTIDNLPLHLLKDFLNKVYCDNTNWALALDLRCKDLSFLYDNVSFLKYEYKARVIYLYASVDVILNRFKITRRYHPINLLYNKSQLPLDKAIYKEITFLEPVKNLSDIILDTSFLSRSDLLNIFKNFLCLKNKLTIYIYSFAYSKSYIKTDFLFDLRAFPNPYYIKDLQHLTGLDEKLANFFSRCRDIKTYLKLVVQLLKFVIPIYFKEGRPFLQIAFSCTGGQHRSVWFANEVKKKLQRYFKDSNNYNFVIVHKDLIKDE